jgi:hypothetical protein
MPPAKRFPVVREVQLRVDQEFALCQTARGLGVTPSDLIRRLIDDAIPGLAQPITKPRKGVRNAS